MKKRVLSLFLVAAMAVGVFTGCSSDSGEKEETAKVFNMPIGEMPEVLAPTDGTDTAMSYLQAMYERLYYTDADGEESFLLAESCEPSEDKLTYTLKLKDDLTWSDGEPITAEDVLFTVEYYQTYAQSVVSTLTSGYTATEVDEKTVELKLETPTGSFRNDFGSVRLIPSHVFDGDVDAVDGSEKLAGTEVVTSGPYTIAEWNAGESMVLKAREDYYRGKAAIETLNFIVMPEENSQKLALDNGEVSAVEITSVEDYEKYSNDDNYNVTVFPAGKVWHLLYNPDGQNNEGLSADERLAVELSLNREEIVETAFGDEVFAMPANTCFASTQEFFNEEITHEQDIDQAKELVASTGMADKTITIIYNNLSPGSEQMAVVIQQELTQAGMNVQVQGYDPTAYYGRTFHVVMGATDTAEATDWDFAIGFESGLYGDSSSNMVTRSTMGMLGEAGSGMMLQAYTTVDDAEREELFKKAQVLTDEGHAFISLVETNTVIVSPKNVKGVDAVKVKPIFLDYWSLDIE